MHEVGITRSIVEIAERTAREEGAKKVLSVTVAIGALSGVVPEAVEFCFEACTRGTMLEKARLIVERVPGRGRCADCGGEPEIDPYTFDCPACGAFGLERLQGDELKILEMEID
ncbi:MAG: hydrogenase maturation nickel metallochaperone HypA [Desulfuromonas sp.]|uniref:hydrogenase maturation nickel metallochaperone HypA n=1 Tax=Desulfuromonas sp. TaxID=892 RepID=UPI000CAF8FF3|nr:hydrogenase maturation nickel metallochaperone HypA [Desulfuromonas sp.]PLX85226.1 MAG: hydrogenase maturation nickel metallochaperone HypA [Desulfuromonas sp.]